MNNFGNNEVKVTESVNEDVVQKVAGYDVLYWQNQGLRQYWFTGDVQMSAELTPEKVMSLGEKWIQLILQTLSPEERLAGLQPEERLKGLPPKERLKGLSPEEIEAYLQELKKQARPGNGERQS